MAADYSELDEVILSAIAEKGSATFNELCIDEAVYLSLWVVAMHGGSALRFLPVSFRPLHTRLQALRKAGRIRYQRKPEGWVLVERSVEIAETGTNEA